VVKTNVGGFLFLTKPLVLVYIFFPNVNENFKSPILKNKHLGFQVFFSFVGGFLFHGLITTRNLWLSMWVNFFLFV
jgi:hypothetical protein